MAVIFSPPPLSLGNLICMRRERKSMESPIVPDKPKATPADFAAAATQIRTAQKIIVVTHQNPDGDAIGSLLSLGGALREMGKTVVLAVDDGTPKTFGFLTGAETIYAALNGVHADLVISADSSSLDRTGAVGAVAFGGAAQSLVLDHHTTNTYFGTVNLVDPDYVSTTEAVLYLLDALDCPLSLPVAQAIMTGLITDTLAFRVGPVSARTFQVAQRLIDAGVDMREIIERTLVKMQSGQLQLMGRGLARAQLAGHVMWTWLGVQDFAEMGLTLHSRPELATEMLKDENAYIAAFFMETESGDVRLSMRATPGFAVDEIAFSFGGGGHRLAAGCTLAGMTLPQAMEKVVPLLQAEAQRGKPLYA